MTDTQKLTFYRDAIAELDPNDTPVARILKEPEQQDVQSSQRCLVLDAAFNPPTTAHWALAQEGARAANAETVLLQLSVANVDKGIEGADLGQRLLMLEAASREDSRTGVSICSHARFVDKAAALVGLAPDTRFVFAIGFDTMVRLIDPKYYRDMPAELDLLFGMAEFVIANRGENDREDLERYLRSPALEPHKGNIHQLILGQEFKHISSSETRKSIRTGKPHGDSLSPAVADVITALGLYKT